MDGRAMKILAAIVDEYIRTGEPVGSKLLAAKPDINVSSATIRNTMAALEQEGYLDHPHTSAGRVPTFKGYRFYIDNLMSPEPINKQAIADFDERIFEDAVTDEDIIKNASAALAEITKCATFSTNHVSQFSVITKVDVIPTGKRMYVLLLITSNGEVKNRVCRMEFDLTHEQMEFFTRFVNSHLQGVNLANMTDAYISELAQALGSYMMTLSPLLYAVCELSNEAMRDSIEVKGESNLLSCQEFPMIDVMKFLEKKNELSAFLDSAFSGINIKFGEEDGTFAISNSTFVSASYYKDGKPAGTLGVIGPMRLDYRRVIPYIEYFTNKVTQLLSEQEESEQLKHIESEAEQDGKQ
ncbi:MAG: heat-inducible transcription repressor HrcA [Oscillospiraceae bacterium]|nr:heat-inducible transcription repressor HrcA [Oscillospiraceae bacterium]